MRTLFQTLLAGMSLFVAGVVVASDLGPWIGTWNLNVAKSTFTPGPAPTSLKRVFTVRGDEIEQANILVGPDGKPIASPNTLFTLDGKDAATPNSPTGDTMAMKRIDATHYEATFKRDGKVVGHMTSTFSDNGKVLTQVVEFVGASGAAYSRNLILARE